MQLFQCPSGRLSNRRPSSGLTALPNQADTLSLAQPLVHRYCSTYGTYHHVFCCSSAGMAKGVRGVGGILLQLQPDVLSLGDTLCPMGVCGREAAVTRNSTQSEGECPSLASAIALRFSKGFMGCEALQWDLETLGSSVNLLLNICMLTFSTYGALWH